MTTAFPLGFFGYSNPDGNNEAAFNAGYSSFAAAMGGAHPKFVDTFVDPNIDPSQWGTNAGWTAWSLASTGSSEVGPGSGTIPVVGMPMATNSTGWSNVDAFLKGII